MFDVEAAKQEVIRIREQAWREAYTKDWQSEYAKKNRTCCPLDIPKPAFIPKPPKSLAPKTWVTHRWATGGIVMDYDAFIKLPKRQQDKIMKMK